MKAIQSKIIDDEDDLIDRQFLIKGTIVSGNKLGQKIGFKTANIRPSTETYGQTPFGVYESETKICCSQKIYRSIVNFGIRPSIKQELKEPIVEVHILDGFCSDIYGEEVEVRFIKKIRDERSFNSLDELKEQIHKDIESIK